MPATVTLGTTTLSERVKPSDRAVKVVSTSGLTPGMALFVDSELMRVVSLGLRLSVNVLRGQGGTSAQHHDSGATAWIGRQDQFYSTDPIGSPREAIEVSPWINVLNGSVWFAQGDIEPTGKTRRWWQRQTQTYSLGSLGVRQVALDPQAST